MSSMSGDGVLSPTQLDAIEAEIRNPESALANDDLLALVGALRAAREQNERLWRLSLSEAENIERLRGELRRERADREDLVRGLLLVRSMPVVANDARHGYDCAGCGKGLGEEHAPDCAWNRAMDVLRRLDAFGAARGVLET